MQELLGRLETRPVDSLALTGDSYRSEGVSSLFGRKSCK